MASSHFQEGVRVTRTIPPLLFIASAEVKLPLQQGRS